MTQQHIQRIQQNIIRQIRIAEGIVLSVEKTLFQATQLQHALKMGYHWLNKAQSYYKGVPDAELKEPEVSDLPEDLAAIRQQMVKEIKSTIQTLEALYRNPGMAELNDNAVMCLEYAWQHMNQAVFNAAELEV